MILEILGTIGVVHAHLAPGRALVRGVDIRGDAVVYAAVIPRDRDVVPDRHGLAILVSELMIMTT